MKMRPMMRYHGGKWLLAPWIIKHFPRHKVYVEPFGGAASVLLRKPRSYAEIYNDLDNEIVNVFQCVRESGQELKHLLKMTPFSRAEFEISFEKTPDKLEQARRTIVRSFQGYGSSAATSDKNTRGGQTTGFRSCSNRSGTTPAHDWKNYGDCFDSLIERVRGIVIENRDACEVMSAHDGLNTLHYIDPPYLMETRGDSRKDYRFEMTDEDHVNLSKFLKGLKGTVVVSGYPSQLYEELYKGWARFEKDALADGAKPRKEVLWISSPDFSGPLI